MLWNPAAESLLGRSARRTVGRALKEIFPPETSLVRHLGDTLATGESRSESEAVIESGDGRPVHVSIVTAPLARSGDVEAAVAVIRDMTRLHQLESEVRRGETLAAAGQIAMGLAHEIRNPLGAIRGAVQLMRRELGDDPRLGEYTDVLLKEVDRVNRIIEMLLDIGRPVTLRPVPLNVHQLLERVALLAEEMASQRGVQIVRRYDPSLPPILADEDRILQVFHNLVRNAMEAMDRGGRLTLVTRLSMNPLFAKVDLGPRAAQHGRDPGDGRRPGHPGGDPRPGSSPRSSPPRTRGWASGWRSATASSRSTAAPSRSRASPARARPSPAISRSPDEHAHPMSACAKRPRRPRDVFHRTPL